MIFYPIYWYAQMRKTLFTNKRCGNFSSIFETKSYISSVSPTRCSAITKPIPSYKLSTRRSHREGVRRLTLHDYKHRDSETLPRDRIKSVVLHRLSSSPIRGSETMVRPQPTRRHESSDSWLPNQRLPDGQMLDQRRRNYIDQMGVTPRKSGCLLVESADECLKVSGTAIWKNSLIPRKRTKAYLDLDDVSHDKSELFNFGTFFPPDGPDEELLFSTNDHNMQEYVDRGRWKRKRRNSNNNFSDQWAPQVREQGHKEKTKEDKLQHSGKLSNHTGSGSTEVFRNNETVEEKHEKASCKSDSCKQVIDQGQNNETSIGTKPQCINQPLTGKELPSTTVGALDIKMTESTVNLVIKRDLKPPPFISLPPLHHPPVEDFSRACHPTNDASCEKPEQKTTPPNNTGHAAEMRSLPTTQQTRTSSSLISPVHQQQQMFQPNNVPGLMAQRPPHQFIFQGTVLKQSTDQLIDYQPPKQLEAVQTPHQSDCSTFPHQSDCSTFPHQSDCSTSPHQSDCSTFPHQSSNFWQGRFPNQLGNTWHRRVPEQNVEKPQANKPSQYFESQRPTTNLFTRFETSRTDIRPPMFENIGPGRHLQHFNTTEKIQKNFQERFPHQNSLSQQIPAPNPNNDSGLQKSPLVWNNSGFTQGTTSYCHPEITAPLSSIKADHKIYSAFNQQGCTTAHPPEEPCMNAEKTIPSTFHPLQHMFSQPLTQVYSNKDHNINTIKSDSSYTSKQIADKTEGTGISTETDDSKQENMCMAQQSEPKLDCSGHWKQSECNNGLWKQLDTNNQSMWDQEKQKSNFFNKLDGKGFTDVDQCLIPEPKSIPYDTIEAQCDPRLIKNKCIYTPLAKITPLEPSLHRMAEETPIIRFETMIEWYSPLNFDKNPDSAVFKPQHFPSSPKKPTGIQVHRINIENVLSRQTSTDKKLESSEGFLVNGPDSGLTAKNDKSNCSHPNHGINPNLPQVASKSISPSQSSAPSSASNKSNRVKSRSISLSQYKMRRASQNSEKIVEPCGNVATKPVSIQPSEESDDEVDSAPSIRELFKSVDPTLSPFL